MSEPNFPIIRLKVRPDFLAAAKGKSCAKGAVVMQARARQDDEPTVRVGFTATKKIGGSVVRNRAKRRMRAAAQQLVPEWAGSGGGRFVSVASAAGLLTMIGNAPYSVTKHGAVAFAEWLSATYRDQGIVVQVVCPQGVRTRMTEDVGALTPLLAGPTAIDPDDVAESLWAALADDRFYVLPHPEVQQMLEAKSGHIDAWLGSMNRLGIKLGVGRDGVEEAT